MLHDDTKAVKWVGDPKFKVGYGQRRNGKYRIGLRVGPMGRLGGCWSLGFRDAERLF